MRSIRTVVLSLVLALVAAAAAHALAQADPAAVVVQVSGAVQVQRAGQTTTATVGMQLMPGDRLVVPTGARAVLLYSSGRMETATADVAIAAPEAAQGAGLFASTVRTLTQVATTDARAQPNRQGMIRPVAGEPDAVSPRNGITVLDLRPTFVWQMPDQPTEFMVQLRRADAECNEEDAARRPAYCRIRRFPAGTDTTWTLPASEPPLVPGATYEWVVGSSAGARVGTTQRFRVIGPEAYAALAGSLGGIAASGLDPAGDGAFLTAVALREAGLLYEAERVLARMAENGAGNGAAFHTLRGEVLDAVGRLGDAEREFALADSTRS